MCNTCCRRVLQTRVADASINAFLDASATRVCTYTHTKQKYYLTIYKMTNPLAYIYYIFHYCFDFIYDTVYDNDTHN